MSHGARISPDACIPMERSARIHAEVDTLSAITIDLAVLAQPGGYDSVSMHTATGVEFTAIPIRVPG